nr:hypothetical protein StreXyl84_54450 [Streptomyces sp. Xyl84]
MTGTRGTDGLGDVQPRIPRQQVPERDGGRPDDDAGLSAELVAVVAAARRRAVRDGDRQTDTAHLLHTLLEADPGVRAVFADGPRIARLLGYLVQRSIGYGLRWQTSVEDSGALPVVSASVGESESVVAEADGCSPAASAALEHARARAARRGDGPAGGLDLLAAVTADPGSRAVEVLARAGIDARELAARIDAADGGEDEHRQQAADARGDERREPVVAARGDERREPVVAAFAGDGERLGRAEDAVHGERRERAQEYAGGSGTTR